MRESKVRFLKKHFKSLIILIITVFAIFSSNSFSQLSNDRHTNNFYQLKPSSNAGIWDLSGSQIYIDNSDTNYTWNKIASENEWCSGSGITTAPYLIENILIDAQKNGSCIEIRNSDVYFIIRNCTLINADYSNTILLLNVSNGMIINNTVLNGDYIGIGLYAESDYNTISRNIIKNNAYNGIHLWECDHNTIFANNVNSNENWGISLFSECYYNNISKNSVSDNLEYGIFIQSSDNNYILDNNATNNDIFGIGLGDSDYNVVRGNYLEKNHHYGIHIVNIFSDSNQIFNNTFLENNINARDDGFDNQWDDGSIGNYWDDYIGKDANDDGIGDTSYSISGSANSFDNFPIWDDGPNADNAPNFLIWIIVAVISILGTSGILLFIKVRILPKKRLKTIKDAIPKQIPEEIICSNCGNKIKITDLLKEKDILICELCGAENKFS